jgi:hypothetical protein
MFDVKIYSPGNNLALMERATQSSTLKGLDKFAASSAIDGDINSFSHTSDNTPWWQVELASISPIEYVEIKNRFCGNVDDLTGCLCRLSGAKLSLLNEIGLVVAEQHLDDTCGKLTVDFRFNPTFPCSDPVRESHFHVPIHFSCRLKADLSFYLLPLPCSYTQDPQPNSFGNRITCSIWVPSDCKESQDPIYLWRTFANV